MSHVDCYILNPLPLSFWGQKKCNLQFATPPAPPPSFIVSYNFPAPLAKPRLRGWGSLAERSWSLRMLHAANLRGRNLLGCTGIPLRSAYCTWSLSRTLISTKWMNHVMMSLSCKMLPNQAILGCPHEPSLQRLHSEVTMMYPHSCFIRLLRFHSFPPSPGQSPAPSHQNPFGDGPPNLPTLAPTGLASSVSTASLPSTLLGRNKLHVSCISARAACRSWAEGL